jgi:hypothetical protein
MLGRQETRTIRRKTERWKEKLKGRITEGK